MKRVFTVLLAFALLLGLGAQARAVGTAAFEYTLELTNDAGARVSPNALSELRAGERLHLNLSLLRTDTDDDTYGIYGIEFQVLTAGLRYNDDGTCFLPATDVSVTHYIWEDVVGFAWLDLERREFSIHNPEDVGQWSYTVEYPQSARIRVQVALVYVTGGSNAPITTRYELLLDAGSGSVVGTDPSGTYAAGTVVRLPDAARAGYLFGGWQGERGVYAAGDSYTVEQNEVLTATWTRGATLTLNANGGTIPTGGDVSGTYAPGTVVSLPKPNRSGYDFQGWSDGARTYSVGSFTINASITLTAKWRRSGGDNPPSPPEPTESPEPTQPPERELDWIGPRLEMKSHPNYVVGYPDGNIHPTAQITRAEVATIFYRLLTAESRAAYRTTENPFPDVSAEDWFDIPVSTLCNAGVLSGYPDGCFYPNAQITRAELTAVITRFVRSFGGTAPFNDVAGHWAYDNIASAYGHSWIKGYEDGGFHPDAKITRAETFAMVNRMLARQPEYESDLLTGMHVFPDNLDRTMWYYLDVQEAANNHNYARKSDGVHEAWTAILPDAQW